MSGLEERERAVELYFTTPMTTAQVVEHLGYPTRQCLERWLAMDSRYAGHMAKPIIPLCFASMFVRQVRQCFSAVWADGFPRCRHRFPVM
ncbi:hypothetical protein [Bifidobacterium longum]|uniref:hypothetical protein n=1 Tax=Bifidobacterium longum TaxID=216816 RepID=UPI001CC336B8|nr:hypothetical protein [Bifidobacterium longum]MBZ4711480.1 hypothetical protein [Bifidobacterium longum subsp. longum]MDW3603003.1 hypothetical protein [Bifidobacterium longum]